MFFKKKPKEESMIEEIADDTKEKTPQTTDELLSTIEKLKAKVEAGEELRKVFNEKFTKLDQDIGEFRNMIIERDKDIQGLEIKATRASDLVSEIKPEKIHTTVIKFETKIEMLKAKLEANEQVNEKIMEELKDIRTTVKTFRGIAEIEKLTKEMLDEQSTIKRIQDKIETYADKTETMYLETDKKYEEFRHFKDIVEDLNNKLSNENRQIKDLRQKIDQEKNRIDQEIENTKKETTKLKIYNDILDELKNITKTQAEQIQSLNKEMIATKRQNEAAQQKNRETLIKIHQILIQIKQDISK